MFQGKVVLVTGAARGIGRAIAELFAQEGALLAVCDMRPEIQELAESLGAFALRADIANERDRERFVQGAVKAWGGLDVLVNNAATAAAGSASQ